MSVIRIAIKSVIRSTTRSVIPSVIKNVISNVNRSVIRKLVILVSNNIFTNVPQWLPHVRLLFHIITIPVW